MMFLHRQILAGRVIYTRILILALRFRLSLALSPLINDMSSPKVADLTLFRRKHIQPQRRTGYLPKKRVSSGGEEKSAVKGYLAGFGNLATST